MRLLSLLPISLLIACTLGDDDLPPPGQPALKYDDGSFSEPNGGTSSYNQGAQMNISWTTTYETTTNSAQSWFQWDVTTDSKNSSEIYVFRAVNGTGTADQKAVGGFLSAAFYIPVKENTTPTSTLSTLSTSATEPAKTAGSSGSQTTPTTTSAPNAGLSEGAKIGIGVGVGVGVVGLVALAAAFLFWRKSKARQQPQGPQPYEMPLNHSPHFQSAQPYDGNQQALGGYYKPPETGETRGVELDAGQGHQFVTEANDHTVTRAELQ
ncbi:hypothetical protein F4801DRAFT_574161 [Xylaria longipes]|nr:hypothetical protein F4801DRAFT_574161 [Xylaria longipes]RYC58464.1 hypothetical protein CHU98_g7744 [Xylaria longipes]